MTMSNTETTTEAMPTANALEQALDQLVTALVAHREARAANWRPDRDLKVICASALLATPDSILRAQSIAADPVNYALKKMIREVGQLLFDALGSTDALAKAADRVAGHGPGGFGQRIAPIDSAFNGVGKGKDRWWS